MANKLIHPPFTTRTGMNFYILLFTSVLLVIMNSCTKKPANKGIKFFHLKYEKAALENWLAADKHTAAFALQFYSTHGQSADTAFGSISYALDSTGAYHMPPDTLTIERDSTANSFDGKIILGNNWISREDVDKIFFKPDSSARDFDYVLLLPKLDKFNDRHVVYELKVYKGNSEIPDIFLGGTKESKPSPPAPPGSH